MMTYFQILAAVVVAVILSVVLSRNGRDMALLLALAVCCMLLISAIAFLKPLINFVFSLKELTGIEDDSIHLVLKAVGIGIVGEMAALICTDAGYSAISKGLQLLTAIVILWISLPLMTALLDLLQQMVGNL